ncbi:hypothetical protein [Aquisalimonas sp.]|uniref:hypothetical protein n=1 Tax=unclassified Aquisalimonas TaxID=2644645 RepID=UPI0025B91B68|nr:hypothetical protein [Aquisalimonas sp.]
MHGRILAIRGISFFLVFFVASAFPAGVSGNACDATAKPVDGLGSSEPLEGIELRVNPQLSVSVPDAPSRLVHNNVVMILDYEGEARIAFREVTRSELDPAIGDTTVSQFLEWAFKTPDDELPSHEAGEFAREYASGLCAQELKFLTRGKATIFAGIQEGGARVAIIANEDDDHGFMHLSTRKLDEGTFGRLLESIERRK